MPMDRVNNNCRRCLHMVINLIEDLELPIRGLKNYHPK